MTQKGTSHWLHERITAALSIPLMLWLVWSVLRLRNADHEIFTAWLAQPLNAGLMILSIITIFYHAALGAQVIVEDYIHDECLKRAKLIGLKLFFLGAGLACVLSILKIAFFG